MSKRYNDARGLVAHCAQHRSAEVVAAALSASSAGWLYCQRSYDETPMKFLFGALSEPLAPYARYIVPAHLRPVTGSPLVDWSTALAFGMGPGQKGIIDVFVESVEVHWG